jgi:hypothetical protein
VKVRSRQGHERRRAAGTLQKRSPGAESHAAILNEASRSGGAPFDTGPGRLVPVGENDPRAGET